MDFRKLGAGWKELRRGITICLLFVPTLLVCLPIVLLVTGSVMGNGELRQYLAPVFSDALTYISWKLVPDYPTFESYGKLLFMTPQFFVLFWNSMKMVGCILLGQLVIGVPAAWAFAVYEVRGSRALFALYVVLMLLPFQVTMLSSYLTLDRLALLDTHWAVILPAVFSTFPIFVIYGGFRAIPKSLIEAARIDGADEFFIFHRIIFPMAKNGISSIAIFQFLWTWEDYLWPYLVISAKEKQLLSVGLKMFSGQYSTDYGALFAATAISIIPVLLIYVVFQKQFIAGVASAAVKG